MSRVKLRDIADYTGTAISTVSAALNGTGRVSPDKAKQIREAAEKLGFKPNLAAQLLKNHEVDIFGLIISDRLTRLTGHGVYSELQEKFLNECRAGKIRTQFELDRTGGVPATFSDGIAKGVIHAGVISEPLRDWLERNPAYPFVSFEEPWKYCVRTDFETGVRKAVQYLAATGHHRIGLFCGPAQFDLSKQMEAGFREGCKEFGREIRPELIRRHSLAVGRDHFLECAQHVREFFSGPVKPDAIIAPGQGFCTVALYELPRLGVRVPEDVSLIGACSGWEAERVYPQLTSIERNIELLVANAMKMLRQLTRGIAPGKPESTDSGRSGGSRYRGFTFPIKEKDDEKNFHFNRVAGCDRHHRDSCRDAAACPEQSPRQGAGDLLHDPDAATRNGEHAVRAGQHRLCRLCDSAGA